MTLRLLSALPPASTRKTPCSRPSCAAADPFETIAAFSYTAFSYILINLRRGYKVGSFGIQKPD